MHISDIYNWSAKQQIPSYMYNRGTMYPLGSRLPTHMPAIFTTSKIGFFFWNFFLTDTLKSVIHVTLLHVTVFLINFYIMLPYFFQRILRISKSKANPYMAINHILNSWIHLHTVYYAKKRLQNNFKKNVLLVAKLSQIGYFF